MRRSLTWALAGAAATSIALAPGAYAEEISSFDVDVTVGADTVMDISETIVYDFESAERRGIFRDIPVRDYLDDGSARAYDIDVLSVTRDGSSEPYEIFDEGDYLRVRIGDPDITITGTHDYQIQYTVANGLTQYTQEQVDAIGIAELEPGDVEVYWDFIGGEWEAPIDQARVRVEGPGPILAYECFVGSAGSTIPCDVEIGTDSAVFASARLYTGDSLTGILAFPQEAFTAPVEEVIEAPKADRLVLGLLIGFVIAAIAIVVPTIVAIATRNKNKGAAIPLAPPQYSPPDGLTAAEMGVAWKGDDSDVRSRAIVATLVDLAARRWVDLGQDGKKLTVTKLTSGTDPIRPWEEALVDSIVSDSGNGVIDDYDSALATTWTEAFKGLLEQARKSGRRNAEGGKPDQRWNFLAFTGITMFGLGILLGVFGSTNITALLIPAGVGCLIGFGLARLITPRTEAVQSAQFLAKVEGLKKVLGTDTSESRREFAHKLGLPDSAIFATMLPYAVIFDLNEAWSQGFPDLTPEELRRYGFFAENAFIWSYLVSDFGRGIRTATTPPSRSSSSGFSGGGAGGGGGGGGGGSW